MSSFNPQIIFWALFGAFFLLIAGLDLKYKMLRDISTATRKPYSFSRVQLAWWTIIVLSSFISIMITKGVIPTFDQSTLILLGISAATTGTARVIDQSDLSNPATVRGQDQNGQDFFLDILSDGTGPNIQRFQTVVFNMVFGLWFLVTVAHRLPGCTAGDCIDHIIPVVTPNNLILLGLSSGVYAALKTTENKAPDPAKPKTT